MLPSGQGLRVAMGLVAGSASWSLKAPLQGLRVSALHEACVSPAKPWGEVVRSFSLQTQGGGLTTPGMAGCLAIS